MRFSFHHLIKFRVDNVGVFQRVSVNRNMTVGKAAYEIVSSYLKHVGCVLSLAVSCRLLCVNQAT